MIFPLYLETISYKGEVFYSALKWSLKINQPVEKHSILALIDQYIIAFCFATPDAHNN